MTDELSSPFFWDLSAPVLSPVERPHDPCYSVKDPTVVHYGGKWHVFCTLRSKVRSHQIEYVSFEKWEEADRAPRHLLRCREGYFCAPQVFYFRPHKKWYLIYQVGEPERGLQLQPAYSTTENIADPNSWSPAQLFFPKKDPKGVTQWIDFWVVCDAQRAYLFFTSLDGRMWRLWTPLEKFPHGFDHCELALQADIFEASHTYRLKGQNRYLTVVEAQGKTGRRYYKAYVADRLDGEWRPLADTEERPFAGAANVRQPEPAWADNISHGELLRAGYDETLEIDPANLRFLVQAVTEERKAGKVYGEIPWRLGLLTPQKPNSAGLSPQDMEKRGWELTFQDEFNGRGLDRSKWIDSYPDNVRTHSNNEQQYYAEDGWEVKGGRIRFKAERRSKGGMPYTSGMISSYGKFSQQHGWFEMRAKFPKGKGMWPAFWLLPITKQWPPEIDILEILGHQPNKVYFSTHWRTPEGRHQYKTHHWVGPDFSADFHTFAVEWRPEECIWYVDGLERARSTQGIPSEPMYILANLAVGGDWPGMPDETTIFPGYMEIDYIRVYRRKAGVE